MNDRKLLSALHRCVGTEACDTDCPGYQYCVGGGGEILEHCAETIEAMIAKISLMADVIEGVKARYVYFAVEKPILGELESFPEAGLLGFHAHDKRSYIPQIDQMGWGFAIYNRRLEHDELMRCGLVSAPRGRA